MIPGLLPLINFLASATGDEAKEKWPKGPTVAYRSVASVPVADYVLWLKAIEDSSALGGQSPKQLVQRIRRLYFSAFTVADKGETATRADALVTPVIPQSEPPLTTDHVPLAVINGLFGTSTIRAARPIEVDVGHLWIAADATLNGTTVGLADLANTATIPLVTWAGDLGSAFREFLRDFKRTPEAERSAAGKAKMFEHLQGLASKEDLLGDFDAVVLSRWWKSLDSFVLSQEIQRYYEGDDKTQAVAKLIIRPKSARRFHWFVNFASDPAIPATGKASLPLQGPLDVTLDEAEMADDMRDILVEATADVSKRFEFGINGDLDEVGRTEFNKLCTKFAEFIKLGLRDGDAPWPPTTW